MKNLSKLKDCEDTNITDENLKPIKSKLCKNWRHIGTSHPKTSLWKSQWQLYGSCLMDTEIEKSLENYFKLGIDFLEKYNVTRAFEKSDIFPGRSYPLESYENALTGHFKRRVYIKCVDSFLGV